MSDVLTVPPVIDVPEGESIRRSMQALVRGDVGTFYPFVLISYGTGRRQGDGPGCGPGMLYCQRVAQLLDRRGVETFSGLHVSGGTDWHVFLEKLNGRFSECAVLVVVVSPALYLSKPCLEEIYNALEAKIWILPILFEGPIPPVEEQWPMITKNDSEKTKLMLTKVTKEFSSLNTIPAPPGTVLEQPEALVQAITDVVAHVSPASTNTQPDLKEALQAAATDVIDHHLGYDDSVPEPEPEAGLLDVFTSAGMSDPAKLVALLAENAITSPEKLFALDQDGTAEILELAKAAKVALGDRNEFKILLKNAAKEEAERVGWRRSALFSIAQVRRRAAAAFAHVSISKRDTLFLWACSCSSAGPPRSTMQQPQRGPSS